MSQHSASAPRRISITRRLTISLLGCAAGVGLLVCLGAVLLLAWNEQSRLDVRSEEYAQAIAETARVPLWEFSLQTVSSIGRSYADSGAFSFLEIKDSYGQILFTHGSPGDGAGFEREIIHEGRRIGGVRLRMDSWPVQRGVIAAAGAIIVVAAIIILVLFLLIGPLLRRVLGRNFEQLYGMINAVADGGVIAAPDEDVVEFRPLVSGMLAMDQTIRRQMEDLRRAEAAYRSLFTISPSGIFRIEPRRGVTAGNAAAARILGFDDPQSLMDGVGRHIESVFVRDDDYQRLARELTRFGRVEEFECDLRRKDGGSVAVRLHAVMGLDEHGRPDCIEGGFEDISQRRLREAAERDLKAAEAANKAKSLFLANMSHEIRTPLAGIMGLADAVLDGPLEVGQRSRILSLRGASAALSEIVNDILDISKIEEGRVSLNPSDFSLSRLLDESLAPFRIQATRKGLTFSVEVDSDIPDGLRGDALRVGQILRNLVGNAVKFTEHGGVVLQVARHSEGKGEAPIIISVRDTGPGISVADQERLFERFEQLDAGYAKRHAGTGLGLSIVRKLVELMGGEVRVESIVGVGSVFHVELPLAAASGEFADPVAQSSARALERRPLKLLLAEDNELNREYLSHYLLRAGHTLHMASNGREVLSMLKRERFDAVLMDVQMPVMDGLAATRDIRAGLCGEIARGVPIIGVTAYAYRENDEQALASGMNAVLHKPVARARLFEELDGVLAGKFAAVQIAASESSGEDYFAGDKSLGERYRALFLNRLPAVLSKLRDCEAAWDVRGAAAVAHDLKTSSAYIGASSLRSAAVRFEQAAKNFLDSGAGEQTVRRRLTELVDELSRAAVTTDMAPPLAKSGVMIS